MEIIVTIISFLFIIALIALPIVILIGLKRLNVKKFKFLTYLILGVVITSIITLTFGWWSDTSNEILLSYYGYDFDAMTDTQRFSNVSPENLERVKGLEISMMGIGWPLKAIMTFIVYSPYILVVYLIVYLIQNRKKKTSPDTHSTY
jgi:hypothetical protein